MVRVKLTGMKLTGMETGPVWVWTDHITSIFSRATRVNDERILITCITVVGGKDPLGVQESVEEVLDMIDSANSGLLA